MSRVARILFAFDCHLSETFLAKVTVAVLSLSAIIVRVHSEDDFAARMLTAVNLQARLGTNLDFVDRTVLTNISSI